MSGSRSGGFNVTVSVVDRATKEIDRINKSIEGVRAPSERVAKSLSRLADNTGITQLTSGMRGLAREGYSAFTAVGRLVGPLGAITGAASIAGIASLAKEWGNLGTALRNTAARANTSVDRLSELRGAADLAGVSADAMSSGLVSLNDNLVNAAAGRAPEAIQAFNYLGIALRDSNGQVRKGADVLPELADKLRDIRDPTIRAKVATMALGGAAEELTPLLNRGGAAINQLAERSRRYGSMTAEGAAAADRLRESAAGIGQAFQGYINEVMPKLQTGTEAYVTSLDHWLVTQRELLHTSKDFGDYLDKAAPQYAGIAKNIDGIAKAIGGWQTVGEGVLLWWGAKFLPGIAGGALRLHLLLKGLQSYLGLKPNEGETTEKYQERRQSEFGDWMERNTGIRPGLLGRMFGGSGGGGGGARADLGTAARRQVPDAEKTAVINAVRAEFEQEGYTPAQIAGALASIDRESGFDPKAVGDGGTSGGLFQHHNDRATTKFAEWARNHGVNASKITDASPAEQARYALYELQSSHAQAGTDLHRAKTAQEAARVFSNEFEVPADREGEANARANIASQYDAPARAADRAIDRGNQNLDLLPRDQGPDLRGRADLNIRLEGFPDGTRMNARTDGDLFKGTIPRIERAMPLQ